MLCEHGHRCSSTGFGNGVRSDSDVIVSAILEYKYVVFEVTPLSQSR